MKKILLGLSILIGTTISSQAFCDQYGCRQALITKIYVTKAKTIFIGTDGDESKANCTSPGNVYFTIGDATTASGKAMYSALLTAMTTRQKLELRTVDGSSNCEIAYVSLTK